MYDPGTGLRYLVHFDDGGSGMLLEGQWAKPPDLPRTFRPRLG
jgi:hypothetical protein